VHLDVPGADRLARRLPPGWRTRFAPSPTGHLHLGHVLNAIYTWGLARDLGGRVVLRLEDHDRSRCRPEFEASILDDLDWLGLVPDEGATSQFRAGPSPLRQSDNDAAYEDALARLATRAHVFACDCTRRDIAQATRPAANEEPPYPGRCTHRGLAPGPGRALRVTLPAGEVAFDDGRLGPQRQDPSAQVGALLLRDRHGHWTYQFAVTVDDVRQRIDLVVRGEDLLASTGRQILLMSLLGRDTPPVYLHHRLILRPDGLKLSKAQGDAGVRELRAAGHSAADVFAMAGYAGPDSLTQP
jgi:glutamyl-tRNA synthetase/glutamyl-Q tRNA(Asp) synthetase